MGGPCTGRVSHPEKELGPNEWIAFPGETLGFMSGGKIRAPVHRVPWIDDRPGPPRLSAPFFLRAAPGAELVAMDTGEAMDCRSFMEHHAVGMRPWRLLRGRK